ncbi:hypothetical protein FE392_02220 [Xenorhabdus sp. 12]|uniref:Uncharacterized protein n=1 Tax=Xenorhabdus santafensis TaxID=2582833 RepID=A0ABU4S4N6_9GAMM|nr:hypothetical protein [Xenorhabdus sp. 12]MDX7986154.1 hypothetical protein [Xenorhabdus sp. 12]
MNNYTVDDIDLKTLRLDIDSPFLAIPLASGTYPKNIYTKVTTTVRDKYGTPLRKAKIFVSSLDELQFDAVTIYDRDNTTKIKIQPQGQYKGFIVETNESGNILFFVHPIKSVGSKLNLFAQILGLTDPIAAMHTIYIVDKNLDELEEKYPEPQILNLLGLGLKSDGSSKFYVKISYDNPKSGDSILFFVNKEYTKKVIKILQGSDLQSYFELPYIIFNENKLLHLSFVVIKEIGSIDNYKSRPLTFTYKGRPNKPWTDVIRTYEACTVYNSSGRGPMDQYSIINDDAILTATTDDPGLFVKVTGTNDPTDTSKVPFGTEIKLNLYITSSTRTFITSFTGRVPTNPDDEGGKTATLTISIPYNLLNNNLGYQDGNDGLIFFDYQIGNDLDPDVVYGNIWQGYIDTYP